MATDGLSAGLYAPEYRLDAVVVSQVSAVTALGAMDIASAHEAATFSADQILRNRCKPCNRYYVPLDDMTHETSNR
jgi:hypothetical protein